MPWEAWAIWSEAVPIRGDARTFLGGLGDCMTLTLAGASPTLRGPMKRSFAPVLSLVVAVLCAPLVGGADVPLAPRRGVLLLNNGELIEGMITAAGDRYDVHLSDGQIRVRRSQVSLVARDVGECYLHRRAEVEVDNRAQDYVELVEWCLRHGLTDEAAREIAAAKAVDATHPKLPLLERRLRLARGKQKTVVPAGAAEPSTLSAQEEPAERPLDVVVRDLPAGSVETFTKNVQPLLLNYCAGSGCHTSRSAGVMRLERIPPNRYTGRKSTQRNLQSVLTMIDRGDPLASKLLRVPITPHGGRKGPVFSTRQQSQYRQLIGWVYQVAGTIQPRPEPTLEERTGPLLERGPSPSASPVNENVNAGGEGPPSGLSAGSYKNLPTRVPEDVPPGHGSPKGSSRQQPTTERFLPKDSFDPEIFNRRFFRK